MSELLLPGEIYAIMGACFEVYTVIGCGFLEAVYKECLAIEFEMRQILFIREPRLTLDYKGRELSQIYLADFVCDGKIVLELKALSTLIDEHRAQSLNYLDAVRKPLAILLNFGHYPQLQYERIALTQNARPQ